MISSRSLTLQKSTNFLAKNNNPRASTVRVRAEKSTQNKREPWDFQRFLKTVFYFNPPPTPAQIVQSAVELPFKAVSTLLPSASSPATTTTSSPTFVSVPLTGPKMPLPSAPMLSGMFTLVFDAMSEVGQRTVAGLLAQGRNVRAVVKTPISTAQEVLGALPAAPGATLELTTIPLQLSLDNSTITSLVTSSSSTKKLSQVVWCASFSTSPQLQQLTEFLNSLLSSGALPRASGQPIYTPDGRSPAKEWGAVDDVVMGGVSSSSFSVVESSDGGARVGMFSGNVTSANNGGFASTRTRNLSPPLNLSAYDGIELKIKGDGQRYKVVIKTDAGWDGIGYTASFDTVPGVWQTVRQPFSSLVPVFRAKTMQGAAAFDPGNVVSLQLMISKFEYDGRLNPTFREGRFELPVEKIAAYSSSSSSSSSDGGSNSEDCSRFVVVIADKDDGILSTVITEKVEELLKDSDVTFSVVGADFFLEK